MRTHVVIRDVAAALVAGAVILLVETREPPNRTSMLIALMAALGVTTVAWTAIYSFGFMVASHVDKNLPKWIAAGVILAVIVHAGVAFYRLRRDEGGDGEEAEGPPTTPPRPLDRAGPELA